ncbi:M48 family metalloprotease [Denitrificimonas sp. JX-1]|uniref:Putative beta-barrel assembly-enhancing protease n=1 Tax=Denitrificimonas halotolerans TaxID=3098930 RepID=A0ABU5GTP4_9GAMM|nr:M48 family metalloprotease [Denitrificimonas sp. JX-1]MDY7218998.1 M48 family metalloprotease [Denitrificimonas sp. JX-1]
MTFFYPALLVLACMLAQPVTANPLPSLGDSSSAIISPQQEHKLGRAWLSVLRGQVRQLEDPLLKDYIETSVYRLAETSQLDDRRLEFIVLASPQLNAFAAPGGIIGVNGGLLLHAQTEAEYASVMAHELAHLSQRHFARGLEAQKRMQVPMMAAMLAGIIATAAGGGDIGMAAIASTQAAAFQEQRRFSRQNEQEADRIGLLNLKKAGFDPRAMPSLFERLMRQYRYDSMPPEFLLTHPLSENRVADTQSRAEQYHANTDKIDSLYYQLIRTRVQLTFEETPGIALKRFRSQLAETPHSEPARYGLALALIRANQLNEAQRNIDTLLLRSPNSIIYHLAAIDLELSRGQFSQAQKRVDELLKKHPNNFPLRKAKYEIQLKQKDIAGAEQSINQLLKQRPNDPDIWFEVAEIRGLSNNIIGLHEARAEYFSRVGDYTQAIQQLDFARQRASNNFPRAARIDARQQELIKEEQDIKKMLN